jgi:serine O-acetyltransferase
MFPNIGSDIRRYTSMLGGRPGAGDILELVFMQGIWAILVYRFGSWIRELRLPLLPHFLKIIYFILNKTVEICTGISISSNALIGKGLYIGHFGGIFIHSSACIGENCSISQGVTVGSRGLGRLDAPLIGDGVYIGSGAKVLGNIRVGNGARIGANAVVISDIPAGATAVGIPAKVVRIADQRENELPSRIRERIMKRGIENA